MTQTLGQGILGKYHQNKLQQHWVFLNVNIAYEDTTAGLHALSTSRPS